MLPDNSRKTGGISGSGCSASDKSNSRPFEIFDFKNAVTLKTGLGSVKVVGNVTMR